MLVSPSSSSLSASSTSSGMHDHRVVPVEQIIIFAVRIGSVIQSWNFIPYLEGIVVGIKGSIHHKKWGSSAIWSLHVCALVGLSSCFVRGSEGTAPPSVSYPLSFRSRRSEGTRTGTQILSMMRGSGMMRGNSRLTVLYHLRVRCCRTRTVAYRNPYSMVCNDYSDVSSHYPLDGKDLTGFDRGSMIFHGYLRRRGI